MRPRIGDRLREARLVVTGGVIYVCWGEKVNTVPAEIAGDACDSAVAAAGMGTAS